MSDFAKKSLTSEIQSTAKEMGFDVVGFTSLSDLEQGDGQLQDWIEEGRHGDMTYLEDFKKRRQDFFSSFPDAKSVIVLGVNYYSRSKIPDPSFKLQGRVARYAWGKDYHTVIKDKHEQLIENLKQKISVDFNAVSCVDTKPLLERFAASKAGLGFAGKNTMLLSREYGPWLFLSEIVTNLDLEESIPEKGDCGTCVKCQEICPTGALDEDYQIDARLCIAYLTIEHKGVIPRELRPQIKDWVFGCDECLNICPFTSHQKQSQWPELLSESGHGDHIDFETLFSLTSNRIYEKHYRGTALLRANRKQMLRNACVVLGNTGKEEALPYLQKALQEKSSMVRVHAAWALGQIEGDKAREILEQQKEIETDADVLKEIGDYLTSESR